MEKSVFFLYSFTRIADYTADCCLINQKFHRLALIDQRKCLECVKNSDSDIKKKLNSASNLLPYCIS